MDLGRIAPGGDGSRGRYQTVNYRYRVPWNVQQNSKRNRKRRHTTLTDLPVCGLCYIAALLKDQTKKSRTDDLEGGGHTVASGQRRF